ncbi:MAG: hypothetical protein HFG49_05990 [Lachnospiraceae bacterium]|jgi:hypothetical protein|nr:hypothetical protein [Lachnospiraceae bacterium]
MGESKKSLAVYDWGMEFYDPNGNCEQIKNEELTEIRIIPGIRYTLVKFYAGRRCVGVSRSDDENYPLLMKYLRCNMAEKINVMIPFDSSADPAACEKQS